MRNLAEVLFVFPALRGEVVHSRRKRELADWVDALTFGERSWRRLTERIMRKESVSFVRGPTTGISAKMPTSARWRSRSADQLRV